MLQKHLLAGRDRSEGEEVKRRKVAISLAIVAALVGPLVTGTWKLKSGGWHPLPVDERERIAKMATQTDNCSHFPPAETELSKLICTILLSDLHAGGRYESGERITWRYVAKNLELMVGAFVFVFLAAMMLPALGASRLLTVVRSELLAPVYGWFTEGFDTRDLKEAKALLEQLAS
jgi:hypothetical protein